MRLSLASTGCSRLVAGFCGLISFVDDWVVAIEGADMSPVVVSAYLIGKGVLKVSWAILVLLLCWMRWLFVVRVECAGGR